MGLGVSIFLIAVGAILAFAVSVDTEGFDVNVVGIILLAVGALGVLLSLVFWSSWGGFHRGEGHGEMGHGDSSHHSHA